jgi:hypothetical protein
VTYTPIAVANLRALIVATLVPLGLWSANAEELLCATCAQESHMGTYRQQVNGPALGIYQMEPGDFEDIWRNYLVYHGTLKNNVLGLVPDSVNAQAMVFNDRFATAMARVHYLRLPKALPAPTDLQGLWLTYKVGYNSVHGAATQDQFNNNYKRYVTDGKAT